MSWTKDEPRRRRSAKSHHHEHGRGTNPGTGLPRQRGHGPGGGTWPVHTDAPKPPVFSLLKHDVLGEQDPEPVFGQYPRGLLNQLMPYLRATRREVLHVCSGALRRGEGLRVDLREAARPDVRADGRALPFRSGVFRAVMIDPPYTEGYARDLYGIDYPKPSHLLAEAARVVRPCGRIGFVHYIVPYSPPCCRLIKVLGLSTGCGYAMRAVTIFEREQDGLPLRAPDGA